MMCEFIEDGRAESIETLAPEKDATRVNHLFFYLCRRRHTCEHVIVPASRRADISQTQSTLARATDKAAKLCDSIVSHQTSQEATRLRQFLAPMLDGRSEEHTSELQSRLHLVCRLLL